MRKFFYARLAADNLKKNRQTYLPYLISSGVTCMMIYIICSLANNETLSKLEKGGTVLPVILRIGTVLAMFFAAIFLFYTNSFLIKHRRKEFGLYQLLGMEKRHLARVLLLETLYTLLITMLAGVAAGILLDKLMFLLVLRILGGISDAKIPLGFHISGEVMLYVTAYFGIVFLLILINAVRIVHFTKPVTMLSQANAGEREPKTKIIMAILGAVLLGAGYTMSLRAKNSEMIIKLMLPAVLSVIAGTYFLFMAGSIALLKLLKKNKSYYYKTRHFTAISGMIYRMKQNAVGLASICILSTMVLVMISSTTCMLTGMDDLLKTMFPREVTASKFCNLHEESDFIEKINAALAENNIEPENPITYARVSKACSFTDGKFIDYIYSEKDHPLYLKVVSNDYYSDQTGISVSLEKNEILLASNAALPTLRQQTEICGQRFKIKQLTEPLSDGDNYEGSVLAVVSDPDVLKTLSAAGNGVLEYIYAFDMPAEQEKAIFGDMETRYSDTEFKDKYDQALIDCRDENRAMYMSVFGGMFFLALFLGVLFTVQMVLMIYYKQISEGHDDRRRYVIMQNVGMSLSEVKQTIRSQILTVFFLPLVMAAIHTAFCIPIIRTVLFEMELVNFKLIYLILGCTFLAFSLLYAFIYAATAKIYYRIVSVRTAY